MRPKKEPLNKPIVTIREPRGLAERLLKFKPVKFAVDALLATDPMGTFFRQTEPAVMYASRLRTETPNISTLNVMTWNIKFGGGRINFFFDSHGDRVHMTEIEVRHNVSKICEAIRLWAPDILLLQEVDVESKRCAFVDIAQTILDDTHLNFAAYASQWKADYIPSYSLGRVNSGNAVFSRWPIHDAKRIALPTISSQDPLTQYFWLRRNLLHAVCDTPLGEWSVVNTHLSAYSNDGTKKRQIDRVSEYASSLGPDARVILGGDFNVVPPGTKRLSDFDDVVSPKRGAAFESRGFEGQEEWLSPLFARYNEAISLDAYRDDNSKFFTHTTDGDGFWNRRLDYLFTNSNVVRGEVHQDQATGLETMPLSDHAPVSFVVE